MSSLVEEYGLYDLTKKERVIYLAKKDPFLKVERISQLAETTSHYVRTVLSEANLSLTKLRKQYVKKLEDKKDKNKLLLDLLNVNQLGNLDLLVHDNTVLNKRNKYNDIIGEKSNFLERTILFQDQNVPIMVNTTIVSENVGLNDFEELENRADTYFSENRIRAEVSDSNLAKLLNVSSGSPVLTLEKEIFVSEELIGLDLVYFIPGEIELLLKVNNDQITVINCENNL
ncbi:hypothetical protein [Orenia marismortui]|uniref:Uncharacterized protein n=1 Tax=Orenia marismortui TaxID=46469 RepID=A0A4R8HFW6_9FIRM|nr:hypothetical protein [Orenia marismortui]TDX59046.1 hypothetical protein C7959_102186 [Orenia marismortui]